MPEEETDEDVIKALEDMGLDRDEADVYRLLIARGMATVSDLSRQISFSRTKIYNIFDRLISKGWVKLISETPKTVIPIDPEKILESKRRAIVRACRTAVGALKPIYNQVSVKISEITVLRGFRAFRKVEEMIKGAQREVKIVTSIVPIAALSRLASLLMDTKKRGIAVLTIFPEDIGGEEYLETLSARVCNVPTAGIVIVDGNEVFIGGIDLSSEHEEMIGIWTQNRALVTFNSLLFDTLYSGSITEKGD